MEMRAVVKQAEEEHADEAVTVVVEAVEHSMGNTTTVEG